MDTFYRACQRLLQTPSRSNPLGEMCHLRLDGSLINYIDKFYQRHTHCDELSEPQQVAIFIAIEPDAPAMMEDMAALAHAYI
jgi:hypothetical protein